MDCAGIGWMRGASRLLVRQGLALLVGLTGLADMLSLLLPRIRLESWLSFWPLEIEASIHSLSVMIGFFLILLSRGLARGKSQAWQLTVALLLFSTLLHVLRGGHVPGMMTGLAAMIGLLCLRPFFRVRSDPPSLRRGYAVLAVGVLLVILYALGGFLALRDQFVPALHLENLLRAALRAVAFAHLLHFLPGTLQAERFADTLPMLSLSALLVGLAQILRPVARALGPGEAERAQVEWLVRRYGKNSISFFGLTPEKAHFVSSDGRVALSYCLVGRVAVVAGDPSGPDEALEPALREFARFCAERDWEMVFWQVRAELLPLYSAFGLQALKIGEEAVLETATFNLSGGAIQNVRASMRHAEKAGLRARFFQGLPEEPAMRGQLERISADWLAEKGGAEMGFSMGRFAEQDQPEVTTAVALDERGRVHGFLTFVPVYGRQGWSLDLMRRSEQAVPGVTELLIVRAVEYFRAQGAEMVSLGLAPQANTCEEQGSALEQAIGYLTRRIGGLSKARSLFSFKRKFQPRWESRYLIYPGTLSLPLVGLALLRAHVQRSWLSWLIPARHRQPMAALPSRASAG